MKKLIPLLFLCSIPAVVTGFGLNEKKYSVELTANQWTTHINGLNYVIDRVMESDLSAKQKSTIVDSVIIPLQVEVIKQVRSQSDTTKKK